jgi:YidC/Oxa1 family membrane protein insertase
VSILNPLFDAVAWVMMRIHAGLAVPFGASSGLTWCLSIVILVVLMRLIMVPLFIKQRNSMQKMQSHMPQLAELRKKYKNDKQKLNEETMKFYKENGINPLGGCLPLLAQLPVFWSLFNVLKAIAQWTPGHNPSYGLTIPVVESAREARIFGVSLYDEFLRPAVGETLTSRLIIVAFVLISAATTFLTMRQSQKRGMLNQTPTDPDQPGAAAAQAMSKNMMYIAPFFALTGLYWQFGLVIYWVTTNIWTLGQQHFLFRNLPIVGSATVGASATQAASGTSGAARNTASGTAAKTGTVSAKAGTTTRTGTAAKPGTTARAGTAARAATAPKAGTAARTGTKPVADTKPVNSTKPASKNGTSSSAAAKAPAAKANANGAAPVNGSAPASSTAPANGAAAANGAAPATGTASNGSGATGSGLLRRFGKKEEPQDDVPVAPQTKVVRQQPVRQTRSKRGNTGKR